MRSKLIRINCIVQFGIAFMSYIFRAWEILVCGENVLGDNSSNTGLGANNSVFRPFSPSVCAPRISALSVDHLTSLASRISALSVDSLTSLASFAFLVYLAF